MISLDYIRFYIYHNPHNSYTISMRSAEDIIELLNLKPLPFEGGYYRETYRSDETISSSALPPRYKKDKPLSTSIYYLITDDSPSLLHRIKSDETYHFYLGSPVILLLLKPDGASSRITLGRDLRAGQHLQATVAGETWHGSILLNGEYALLGTTVSPGFDEDDFELGLRDELISRYPEERKLIKQLTKS